MKKGFKNHVALFSVTMSLAVMMMLSGCSNGSTSTTIAPSTTESTALTTAAETTAESEELSTAAETVETTAESEAPSTEAESKEAESKEVESKEENEATTTEAQEPAGETETKESSNDAVVKRQVGDRYEEVIVFQGVEEKITFERIANETVGFEMDYDCGNFSRKSDENGDVFALNFDGSYYMEVTSKNETADAIATSISEELSKNYDVYKSETELNFVGNCTMIHADIKTVDQETLDELQTVYIIPAADGCYVATAHYGYDSSDYYGKLFSMMADSFSIIEK